MKKLLDPGVSLMKNLLDYKQTKGKAEVGLLKIDKQLLLLRESLALMEKSKKVAKTKEGVEKVEEKIKDKLSKITQAENTRQKLLTYLSNITKEVIVLQDEELTTKKMKLKQLSDIHTVLCMQLSMMDNMQQVENINEDGGYLLKLETDLSSIAALKNELIIEKLSLDEQLTSIHEGKDPQIKSDLSMKLAKNLEDIEEKKQKIIKLQLEKARVLKFQDQVESSKLEISNLNKEIVNLSVELTENNKYKQLLKSLMPKKAIKDASIASKPYCENKRSVIISPYESEARPSGSGQEVEFGPLPNGHGSDSEMSTEYENNDIPLEFKAEELSRKSPKNIKIDGLTNKIILAMQSIKNHVAELPKELGDEISNDADKIIKLAIACQDRVENVFNKLSKATDTAFDYLEFMKGFKIENPQDLSRLQVYEPGQEFLDKHRQPYEAGYFTNKIKCSITVPVGGYDSVNLAIILDKNINKELYKLVSEFSQCPGISENKNTKFNLIRDVKLIYQNAPFFAMLKLLDEMDLKLKTYDVLQNSRGIAKPVNEQRTFNITIFNIINSIKYSISNFLKSAINRISVFFGNPSSIPFIWRPTQQELDNIKQDMSRLYTEFNKTDVCKPIINILVSR